MKKMLLLGAMLTLSACGGSGGGLATLPTPTPAPTPTPGPTYTKFADLTGDQLFQTASVTMPIASNIDGAINSPSQAFGSGYTIDFDAATNSYTVSGVMNVATGAPVTHSQTFVQSEITRNDADALIFSKPSTGAPNVFIISVPKVNSVPLTYTRISAWNTGSSSTPNIFAFAMLGVPTKASDVPTTGSATYKTGVGGVASTAAAASAPVFYDLSHSTATLSANFATGSITTDLTLTGVLFNPLTGGATAGQPDVALGIFNGTGLLNAGANTFGGSFVPANGATALGSSNFFGAFFGPQALEFGYVYDLRTVNGAFGDLAASGYVYGIKQ